MARRDDAGRGVRGGGGVLRRRR